MDKQSANVAEQVQPDLRLNHVQDALKAIWSATASLTAAEVKHLVGITTTLLTMVVARKELQAKEENFVFPKK